MQSRRLPAIALALAVTVLAGLASAPDARAAPERARDLGIAVGVFPTGEYNAITDVKGVRVGHSTIIKGDDIRTGVTAIVPARGNLFTHPIPAWIHVGNGYGKMIGATQVRELGELETPILLTCTLCVWRAAQGLVSWVYDQQDIGEETVNPVVGEVNDSRVNNMWADPVGLEHVYEALNGAHDGPVLEGTIGAGTGTQAFGWKGGIGTSSRKLPRSLGGWTVGVLVQTNFGGNLTINSAPVGRELERFPYQHALSLQRPTAGRSLTDDPPPRDAEDGSIIIVLATDAPLQSRNLRRLSERAIMGLARTGSFAHNGSGDYVIAFSTHPDVRHPRFAEGPVQVSTLPNPALSPLFAATAEATEEAVYNALFTATAVTSSRGTLQAIPQDEVLRILRKYNSLYWGSHLPPGRID
ncbi:MAG TPA: P1 family peptidase [Pseudomonadales bacterium]